MTMTMTMTMTTAMGPEMGTKSWSDCGLCWCFCPAEPPV